MLTVSFLSFVWFIVPDVADDFPIKIQTKEISIDQFRYIKIHTSLRGMEE